MDKLLEALRDKKNQANVDLTKLKERLKKKTGGTGATAAQDMLRNFPNVVRVAISAISKYLKRENIELKQLFDTLDVNRDGKLDKEEFVTRMQLYISNIEGVHAADLGAIFDHIDVNHDGQLTLVEFGLYLEGASKSHAEKRANMDP